MQGAETENDPQFEPVIKLEHQVEVKTNEEDEDVQFKMYVLFADPVVPSCFVSTKTRRNGRSVARAMCVF